MFFYLFCKAGTLRLLWLVSLSSFLRPTAKQVEGSCKTDISGLKTYAPNLYFYKYNLYLYTHNLGLYKYKLGA